MEKYGEISFIKQQLTELQKLQSYKDCNEASLFWLSGSRVWDGNLMQVMKRVGAVLWNLWVREGNWGEDGKDTFSLASVGSGPRNLHGVEEGAGLYTPDKSGIVLSTFHSPLPQPQSVTS